MNKQTAIYNDFRNKINRKTNKIQNLFSIYNMFTTITFGHIFGFRKCDV